jgi:hypothetical protein
VAVAVSVIFAPTGATHPLKVNIPPDDEGVQVNADDAPVTFTEIDPA